MLKYGARLKRFVVSLFTIFVVVIGVFNIAFTASYFSSSSSGESELEVGALNAMIMMDDDTWQNNNIKFMVNTLVSGDDVIQSVKVKLGSGSLDGFVRVKIGYAGSVTNSISQAVSTALNIEANSSGYNTYSNGTYEWEYRDGYYYLVDSTSGELIVVEDGDDYFLFDSSYAHTYLPSIEKYNIAGANLNDVLFCIDVQAIVSGGTDIDTPAEMDNLIVGNDLFAQDDDTKIFLVQFNTLGGKKLSTQIVSPDTESIVLPSVDGINVTWYANFESGVYSNSVGISGSEYLRENITTNMILYAKYQDNKIAVIFDKDVKSSGSLPATSYITYNAGGGTQTISVGSKLVKTGYNYTRWKVDVDVLRELNADLLSEMTEQEANEWVASHTYYNVSTTNISVLRDVVGAGMAITLTPDWQLITYTATFNTNGGDLITEDRVLIDSTSGNNVYALNAGASDEQNRAFVYEYSYNVETVFTFPSVVNYDGKAFQGWIITSAGLVGNWRINDCYISGAIGDGFSQNVTFVAQWGELYFTHASMVDNEISIDYTIGGTITLGVENSTGRTPTYTATKDQEGEPVTSDVVEIASSTADSLTLNIIKAGTAVVSARVMRAGVLSISRVILTVNPRAINASGITITAIPNQIYTGSGITPVVEVLDGGVELVLDTDYEVSYSNNINVGTDTAVVTIRGKGNYSSSTTKIANFTIVQKAVTIKANAQTITYGDDLSENVSDVTATGLVTGHSISEVSLSKSTENVPGGTIIVDSVTIVDGELTDITSNYDITYDNTGVLTINKANAYVVLDDENPTVEYSLTSKVVSVEDSSGTINAVSDDNATASVAYSAGDITISDISTLNAGTEIVVSIDVAESANYNAGTVEFTLTIVKFTTTITSVEISGICMLEQTLTVSVVRDGDGTINYQWSKCSTVDGEYVDIVGATSSTYSIPDDVNEIGKYFRVSVTVDESTNYTAVETPTVATTSACLDNRFTVTFVKQNGTGGSNSVIAKYQHTMPTADLVAPTRTGYTFGGYYIDEECVSTQYYTASMTSSETYPYMNDINLYAKWTVNVYSITFANGGGTGSMSDMTSLVYDTAYQLTTNAFTRTHYTFIGWKVTNNLNTSTALYGSASGNANDSVDSDTIIPNAYYIKNLYDVNSSVVTLTAQWDADVYAVTLDKTSGITDGTTTIYEKYETGIYSNIDCTNEMTTSTNAITKPIRYYTITFEYNGATGGNTNATLPTNYDFDGFYTSANGGVEMIDGTYGRITSNFDTDYFGADGTLYAHWAVGTPTLLPTPTKSSYTFMGWYSDSELTTRADVGGYYTALENTTLYAKWQETFITFSSESSFTLDSLIGHTWGSNYWGQTNAVTSLKAGGYTYTNNGGVERGDGHIYYSTDLVTWTEWAGNVTLNSTTTGATKVLYLRGSGNRVITGVNVKINGVNYGWMLASSNNKGIRCDGNIENLLDYATVATGNHPEMDQLAFRCLFANCTALITAPKLPSPTTTTQCYATMFQNTSLYELPELPATTLANNCYAWMFKLCTNIKMSNTVTDVCTIPYRIPAVEDSLIESYVSNSISETFAETSTVSLQTNSIKVNSSQTFYVSHAYKILLDNANATTDGTSYVFEDADNGNHYLTLSGEDLMTTSANSISIPSRSFTVTYNYNGATSGNGTASNTYTWTFAGYNYNETQMITSSGRATSSFTTTEFGLDKTLHATWNNPVSAITLPSPSKTGYLFGGWYSDSELTSFAGSAGGSYSPASTLILYAKWTPITYSIHFDSNNPDEYNNIIGSMSDQVLTYDTAANLSHSQFLKPKWTFDYWSRNADGSGDTYADEAEVLNLTTTNNAVITLYLQWEEVDYYTITLNASGTVAGTTTIYEAADDYGLCLSSNPIVVMTTSTNPIPDLPENEYTITYNYDGATTTNGPASTDTPLTFYGYYDGQTQMITHSGYITSALVSAHYFTNTTLTALWGGGNVTLPSPQKLNYVFQGWYSDSEFKNYVGDGGDDYLPTGDTTLYAKWRANFVSFISADEFTIYKKNKGTTPGDGKKWEGHIYYSTSLATEDGWSEWTNPTESVKLSSVYDSTLGKHVLYMKGVDNTILSGFKNGNFDVPSNWDSTNYQWYTTATADLYLGGNFESLLDWEDVKDGIHPAMGLSCAWYLFKNFTKLKEIEKDFLSSPTLAENCYRDMFRGCAALTTPPDLPALSLAKGCYESLFRGCTTLTKAPALPANISIQYKGAEAAYPDTDKYAEECYMQMFNECKALTMMPLINYTNYFPTSVISSMFNGAKVYMYETGDYDIYLDLTGCTSGSNSFSSTFTGTSGTFKSSPALNHVYYTSTPLVCTVFLDKQGGTGGSNYVGVKYGDTMPYASAPTKVGYTFAGYYDSSDHKYYNADMTSAKTFDLKTNTTLYAHWTVNTYTVVFDTNGGNDDYILQELTYGSAEDLTANTFTRAGYNFTGWNTEADGSGEDFTDEEEVSNLVSRQGEIIVLYAMWEAE